MSVKSADTLSDVSDHFNGNIEQPCSLHYDYKLINKLTYNHWDCLSACQIESKFILLKKAKFTNYNLPNNALDLKLNIPTFEPNDTLSKYIVRQIQPILCGNYSLVVKPYLYVVIWLIYILVIISSI